LLNGHIEVGALGQHINRSQQFLGRKGKYSLHYRRGEERWIGMPKHRWLDEQTLRSDGPLWSLYLEHVGEVYPRKAACQLD